jgi:hypothetical protein
MRVEQALVVVDTILAPQRLSAIQELVFSQCFLGKTYQEIAECFEYDYDYIRVTGYRLWQTLTDSLGERVTKNNFRAILRDCARQPEQLGKSSIPVYNRRSARSNNLFTVSIPEFPSGAVALDSAFYIARYPIERQAYDEIERSGALIRIRAPNQWGKTSLLLRLLAYAETQRYRTVRLSLQHADTTVLENFDRSLRWFCANVTQQLQLPSYLDDYWDDELGSKVSCTTYLRGHILKQLEAPLVLALDDIHLLFEHPSTAQDFLPLLRVWHEEANNLPIWKQLRLLIAHSTEVYVPLNLHQSPFNVGLPIRLNTFTHEQVQELALRYQFTWADGEDGQQRLMPLLQLLDGHPYLLQLAFYHLAQGNLSEEQLLAEALTPAGIYANHLLRHLTTLQQYPELAEAFAAVVKVDVPIEIETLRAYKLESMGLVKMLGGTVTARNKLYRLYFRDRLRQNL